MEFTKALNPLYADSTVQEQMRVAFKGSTPNVLVLNDFFSKKDADFLFKHLLTQKGNEQYVPHQYRFKELRSKQDIFSFEFIDFVTKITGAALIETEASIAVFGHRDFTLLHDDVSANERLAFFYTLARDWKPEWGGQRIVTFGDERAPLVFEVKHNSLVLLRVPRGMRDFVKYVNHFAGKKEMIILSGVFR